RASEHLRRKPPARAARDPLIRGSAKLGVALLGGSALRRLRYPLQRSDAGGVLVQFAARRVRDLPRLRPRDRRRLRPGGARRSEDAARKRRAPLAEPVLPGVP